MLPKTVVGKWVSGKNCLLVIWDSLGSICEIPWNLYVQIKHLSMNLIQRNEKSCMTILLMKNTT